MGHHIFDTNKLPLEAVRAEIGCASNRFGDESFLPLLLVVLTMDKLTNLSKPWLPHLQNGHTSDIYTS